ncbi:ribonuclease H-like domain-containing protein [Tanacetum coccineum]
MASHDLQWYMDTGATSHLSSHNGNLQTSFLNRNFHSVIVGNRSSIPVTHSGHVQIHNPYRPLHLRNVLVTPNIIKNLVSVRKFTTDNKCSIDFNPYGFIIRDYHTRQTLFRCDNTGDLYPLHVAASAFALLTNNHFLWHQRLGHPGDAVIQTLSSRGLSKLLHFRAFIKTQFNREIKAFQCDHGGEFDNNSLHELFATNGIQFRFSCPRTSQQNGKSERMIRTINNVVRSLLFQARLPPEYWVEALLTATYLLNILPSTSINNDIPYTKLFNKPTSYTHLRTFGCLCYPYTFPPHKLAPRTTPSIFLGYAYNHRGYRCLDLNTNKIIISRHVTFDETVFPFGSMTPTKPPSYQFLDDNLDTSPIALRLLTTPTSPQQTPPQTTPQTNPQTTPQSTPPTPLSTPSPQTTPTPPTTPPPPPPTSQHPMVTRSKVGIVKANPKYNLHLYCSSEKKFMASHDQQWYMDTGATSYFSSHTGNLQTSFLNRNFHSVVVGNGSSIPVTHSGYVQIPNPYRPLYLRNVLFTPNIIKKLVSVLKFTTDNKCSIDFDPYGFTIRDYHTHQTLLRCDSTGDLYPSHVAALAFALLTNNYFLCRQRLGHPGDAVIQTRALRGLLDVKNAFLHGHLTETVYMHQSPGSTDSTHSDYVCLLQKSLYGLNQAPELGFNDFLAMLFEPVSITAKLTRLFLSFTREFAMTDLGLLNYFLGISATRTTSDIFLSQTKYATEILEQAQMLNCNPCRTPIDTEKKLGPEGSPVTDPTLYRSLARSLQYLTFTQPDLSYAVQQLCLYMHDPREPHLNAMKHVLRYLR